MSDGKKNGVHPQPAPRPRPTVPEPRPKPVPQPGGPAQAAPAQPEQPVTPTATVFHPLAEALRELLDAAPPTLVEVDVHVLRRYLRARHMAQGVLEAFK